jgi:peptide deformylase
MIEEEWGDKWEFEEGCLSIPHIRENVSRHANLRITYQDEFFKTYTETYSGLEARVIQHEYDHCQGVLFTDHLSQLKKRLIKQDSRRDSSRAERYRKCKITTTPILNDA